VTLVAVLGGIGILPVDSGPAAAASLPRQSNVQPDPKTRSLSLAGSTPTAGARGDQATSKVNVPTLPANSGTGRRIVFAMAAQRVWLVGDEDDHVERTYPVSGSLTDNLHPGTYSVYSKSEDAVGIDDSGTMKYMVRFAHGPNAAIGFHDIPVLDGAKVQSVDQLGTPQSHGCIRQLRADAKALWDFAPVGTTVVVVA
jgi:L,D-transpeptidase catalytic domain